MWVISASIAGHGGTKKNETPWLCESWHGTSGARGVVSWQGQCDGGDVESASETQAR